MSVGLGYHRDSQARLRQITVDNGHPRLVVSSAGGLVEGLSTLNAKDKPDSPHRKPSLIWSVSILTLKVLRFDAISLRFDNLEVARQDPMAPVDLVDRLNLANVDTLIASACVQMPSLPAVSYATS